MATTLTAQCPSCKTDTLDVRVGRKTTARTTHCSLCGNRYSYSCWKLKENDGITFHQVELVKL